MKAINKFFYALLAFMVVGMVSCTKEATTHEPGAPELEGCYGVYFPDATVYEAQGPMGDLSLDPSEATTFTYVAFRENTDGEITVPVKVIENTTDAEGTPMYTVSDIVFGDGEDVAQFTVALSEKAEVGVPYTLTLEVANDPLYVKQYDITTVPSLSVTINRVKWISLGKCQFTEDLLTSWWGFNWDYPTHPTYLVEVQVRADSIDQAAFDAAIAGTGEDSGLSGIYRMVNAWLVGPWGDDSDKEYNESIAANPIYTIINAQPYDKVWIPLQEIGLAINGGMASIYSYPAALTDLGRASDVQDSMYGKIENGAITFPAEKSLLGCPGGSYVGTNTYSANTDGAFKLVLSAALGTYELAMPDAKEDGDFSFREVELSDDALFYSESQAATWVPVLEKGRCEVSTKDADRIFYKQYGTLYRLPDLYAEGYPIYFAALEDGTITLPKDYINQNTGLVQNGFEVLMAIDAEASTFDPKTGELALVAEFYSAQGDNSVTYGQFSELISTEAPEFNVSPLLDLKNDFTYKALYTAPMTSDFMDDEFDATVEQGTCLNAELDVTAYRLPSLYTNGYDIYFVADEEGNISVTSGFELQPTGVNIYGKPAYLQIVGGTYSDKSVVLKANVCDIEGNALVPATCTETIVNYTWNEVGSGSYYSALYTNEGKYVPFTGRKLLNAEGTNMYRIVEFMGAGSELNFTWDKTTNKCEIIGFNNTAYDAANFGGVGNIFTCDFRTFYQWIGDDYTWEQLAAGLKQDVQPYFDPQANEFVFFVQLTAPEMGVGMALGDGYVEYFTLDGEVSEGPKWVDVATGNYATILSDSQNNQYIAQGVVMQQKEGTDLYRLYDWCDMDADVYLNFQWNNSTNKIDILGLNDSGIPGSIFGQATNAYICDVKTYYKEFENMDVTWEQIAAAFESDLQSFYDSAKNTISFIVCYTFPQNADAPLLADSFFKETYAITASATTSEVSYTKVSSEPIAIKDLSAVAKYRKINAPAQRLSKTASKASFRKATVNSTKPVVRSLKTVTPVKREAKIKQAML